MHSKRIFFMMKTMTMQSKIDIDLQQIHLCQTERRWNFVFRDELFVFCITKEIQIK